MTFYILQMDLVEKYGKLQFSLDYYTDVMDLEYLVDTFLEDNFTKKYKLLNEALTGLLQPRQLRPHHRQEEGESCQSSH